MARLIRFLLLMAFPTFFGLVAASLFGPMAGAIAGTGVLCCIAILDASQ